VSNSEQIAQRLDKWLTDEHLRQHIVSLQRPTLPDARPSRDATSMSSHLIW
jgi:hypothetical protein